MFLNQPADAQSLAPPTVNPFTVHDVATILRDREWLTSEVASAQQAALRDWLIRAAELLGPHATDNDALATLLTPVFVYDAAATLQDPVTQDVLARTGAREVIRALANRVLEAGDIDSDRFKEIIEAIKEAVPYRSRAMFHPIRMALTGRVGEGELDRVILLVDSAAKLNFSVPVKNTRQRMLEFCSALD